MSILDWRIIFVTGKGGVGKTTVCAALGLWAARAGKRTIITETSGAQHLASIFGKKSEGYDPVELSTDLWTLSITPAEAIEEYIVQQVKVRKIYEMVFRNRVMGPFLDAVPGLHDAVQVGKVFDLQRERTAWGRSKWDLVIVDAPATGHGLTLLGAARSMMEATRKGPLYENNRIVEEVLSDPELTALLLVCLPEEMPVNETLEFVRRLGPEERRIMGCVLNQMLPSLLEHPEDLDVIPSIQEASSALQEAASLARDWQRRVGRQRECLAQLEHGLDVPVIEASHRLRAHLKEDSLVVLSKELEQGLGTEVRP